MSIDPRSRLGQDLEIEKPVEFDLGLLNNEAGAELARRINGGKTREEAIVGMLNHAGRLMAEGVVSIDTSLVYRAHTEVPVAVEKVQDMAQRKGQTLTTARSLTKLVIVGSRTILQPPKSERADSRDVTHDLFEKLGLGDIFGDIGRRP